MIYKLVMGLGRTGDGWAAGVLPLYCAQNLTPHLCLIDYGVNISLTWLSV